MLAEPGTSKSRTNFNLSEVYEDYFIDNDGTVTLPKGWMVSKEGSIFSNENGVLTEKAYVMAAELSKEDYNTLLESYGAYYEVEEKTGYKYLANHMSDDSTGSEYDIYFIYNEGLVTEIMFLDASDSEKNTVLNSLVLPAALEVSDTESAE